jgi:hypothetical protein
MRTRGLGNILYMTAAGKGLRPGLHFELIRQQSLVLPRSGTVILNVVK